MAKLTGDVILLIQSAYKTSWVSSATKFCRGTVPRDTDQSIDGIHGAKLIALGHKHLSMDLCCVTCLCVSGDYL